MVCLYLEKGLPSQLGQKRLKFWLVNTPEAEMKLEENEEPKIIPDNVFYQFTELMELPVKTSIKTSEVKQELLEVLGK